MPRLLLSLVFICGSLPVAFAPPVDGLLAQAAVTNSPAPGPYKECPEEGDGGDTILNALKNRSSEATDPHPSQISEILQLPSSTQVGRANPRSHWNQQNLNLVEPYEKSGVVVVGYLRRVKQEGPEHCNCERKDLNDFHMWIIAKPSDVPAQSVVVELTPRWRGANPNWNLNALQHIVAQHAKIRITGWLLFDQEHPDQLHATQNHPIIRGTLWEVHPVTKIEVNSNGQWREL
jgi:hypothetical protein